MIKKLGLILSLVVASLFISCEDNKSDNRQLEKSI